uniref:Uncharacterized protein n=1 Tax=Meloidogyne enterolobii TaxID=390850 RepID=A0A6V7V214_MELEN|nr:unnamed protein product [Meloidogyne enterolobii]
MKIKFVFILLFLFLLQNLIKTKEIETILDAIPTNKEEHLKHLMENSFRNISKVEDVFKARIIILTFLWADFNEESLCKESLIEQIIDEKVRKGLISDEFAECFLQRINYIVEKIVSNNFEFEQDNEKINGIINILKQNEENKHLFEDDDFALNFLEKLLK